MSPSLQRAGTALILAAALAACAQMDQAMRRVDVLDRVFEPERYAPPPAPPPQAGLEAPPLPVPGPPKEPIPPPTEQIPPPTAWLEAEPPSPWYSAEPLPPPDGLSPEAAAGAPPEAEAPAPPAPVDPARRTAALLRQYPWISRFWSQLTPAEQGRVSRALIRRDGSAASPAAAWDPMGLQERVELLFGRRATS